MSRCCSASRSRGVGITGATVVATLIRPSSRFGQSQIRLVRSTIAGRCRDDNRKVLSTTGIFADLAEGIPKRQPQSAGMIGTEVGHETRPGVPHFFDCHYHPRDRVVVVVADG